MKNFKIALASFLLLAVTSLFATKSHAQTTRYFEYTGTNGFTISSGTDGQITTLSNWTERDVNHLPSCSGSGKICYFTISYTVTPPNTEPTDQQIMNALAGRYTDTGSTHSFDFDSMSTDTITITNVGGTGTTVTYVLHQKS